MQTLGEQGVLVEATVLVSQDKKNVIRVLHVDDDPSLQDITKLMLLDLDSSFEIDSACCVYDAFKKLSTEHYDVVVSDYEMPQKDGLQFLIELRKQNNRIPFILFTGKGREELAIKALNLGADGYHNKQGSPETVYGELAHAIVQLVNQNRLKTELANGEVRFKQFFSNLPNAVAVYEAISNGEDFVFKDFNAAAEKIEKTSKADIIGKRVTEAFPGAKDFGILEIFKRVWKTGQYEYFSTALYQDKRDTGSWRENWIFKLPNGNVVAIYNDVTERVKTDLELKRTNEVLERVGEGIDAGLAVIGKDYRVVWANKRLMALGVAPNKKCHQTFNNSETICPDCGVKKIFEQNSALDVHEFKTLDSKGETIWIELRVTPFKDKNENVTAALELAIPITERKKAEQKIEQEAILRNTLLDNLPCTALILEKKTRKIVASNKIAQENGAFTGGICYETCAKRTGPCTFCLAPKLWATNETQSLEVEYEGKFYRGIWVPYNEDLYVHYIFDITEYKKNKAALLLSEEKFRKTLKKF